MNFSEIKWNHPFMKGLNPLQKCQFDDRCQHYYQHRVPESVSMSQDLGAVAISCGWGEDNRLAWGVQEQLSYKSNIVSNLIPSTVYTDQCRGAFTKPPLFQRNILTGRMQSAIS